MSMRRERDEDALREKFKKENPEQADQMDAIFDQLSQVTGYQVQQEEERETKAVETWEDLFIIENETIRVRGQEFVIRKHATALEHLQSKRIETDEELIRYIHKFIISPEIPIERFMSAPDYIYKYIESKIKENFLMGLTQIALMG